MHKLFPNAILIPDRFHIIIQAKNALDKTKANKNMKKHILKALKYE